MNDCPNCGSPVRPGAKFCTTCGFRLAEGDSSDWAAAEQEQPTFDPVGSLAASAWADARQPAPDQSATSAADDSATDAPVADRPAADAWNDPTWQVETTVPSTDAAAVMTDDQATEQPAATGDSDRAADWAAPAAASADAEAEPLPGDVRSFSFEQADEPPAADRQVNESTEEPASLASDQGEQPAPVSSTDSADQPDHMDQADTAGPLSSTEEQADDAWRPTRGADEGDALAIDEDELASAVEAMAAPDERDPFAPDAGTTTNDAAWMRDADASAAVVAEETAWDEDQETAQPAWDDVQETAALATATTAATVVAPESWIRANQLFDELRDLMLELAASPPAEGEADRAEISRELAAVQPSEDDDDFADLRQAVQAARDRPRDIDTMLDLSLRLDSIGRLLDEHDRAMQAIDRAVMALGDTL